MEPKELTTEGGEVRTLKLDGDLVLFCPLIELIEEAEREEDGVEGLPESLICPPSVSYIVVVKVARHRTGNHKLPSS